MKPRYFSPLAGFVVPSLLIGFGVVIPGSCIAGVNNLTIGFATTLLGACGTYWLGIRAVLSDRVPSLESTRRGRRGETAGPAPRAAGKTPWRS